jgi:nucleotide-binding universal stress UspA family protein
MQKRGQILQRCALRLAPRLHSKRSEAAMLANRRILCPTDFSLFSERALEHAIALADPGTSVITVLHVVPPLIPPAALPFPMTPTLDVNARQAALDAVGRFSELARKAGIRTELEVREGSIAGHVVKLAETLPADLVVMGTHGLTGFERLMLGSVTERVLRRAPCPVLTVPRALPARGDRGRRRLETILCPLDFADPSAGALRVARALARENHARLLLVHVIEGWAENDVRDHSHWAVPEYRRFLEKEGRARLDAALGAEDREACRVETILEAGKPYVEILRIAAERAADLVVMGVHGARTTDLNLFGSTAQHVVRQATCPVLTVRSGREAQRREDLRELAAAGTKG